MTEEPCKCPENMREALPLAAYEAAMEGRVQHVRAWLNAGGDVNATTMLSDKLGPGMSLLAAACYQGQADVVRELLKNPMTHLNTRHNTECGMNCTPMYIAAHSGYDNCISALLTSKLKGKIARHEEVNDIIKRSLATARCPAQREPHLSRPNDPQKRPDGVTLLPWKDGKQVVWDYTCAATLASTYLHYSTRESGGAASFRESQKIIKYRGLAHCYSFVPIGSETLG
ncbi:uncharacterized protein [Procambarus clarkii]|uniref:uncharacterized protein isoform X3 n=1 Tax=Procambarus clarkii TaxID=6728 RepID=UPI00374221D2